MAAVEALWAKKSHPAKGGATTVDGRNPANQLRLVVYPSIGFYTYQVVSRISAINSMTIIPTSWISVKLKSFVMAIFLTNPFKGRNAPKIQVLTYVNNVHERILIKLRPSFFGSFRKNKNLLDPRGGKFVSIGFLNFSESIGTRAKTSSPFVSMSSTLAALRSDGRTAE